MAGKLRNSRSTVGVARAFAVLTIVCATALLSGAERATPARSAHAARARSSARTSWPAPPRRNGMSRAAAMRRFRDTRRRSAWPMARRFGFKVKTDASNYRLDIYRLGWYGGLGARMVTTVLPSAALPQSQPECIFAVCDAARRLRQLGRSPRRGRSRRMLSRASTSRSWCATTPAGRATSSSSSATTQSHADLLFQTSDTTWQAYNRYGGYSLYSASPAGRAYKVSYNRPFDTRAHTNESFLFSGEYPMIRWLERNGYDVSYVVGDRHRPARSRAPRASRRSSLSATTSTGRARSARTSRRRETPASTWRSSAATRSSGRPGGSRASTAARRRTRPSSRTRRPRRARRSIPAAGVDGDLARPEVQPTGGRRPAREPADRHDRSRSTPTARTRSRSRRASGRCASGATRTSRRCPPAGRRRFPLGTLGHEWDEDLDNGYRPAGLMRLSSTTLAVPSYIQDYGDVYGPGTGTHSLTLYRAPSGALVFAAGTVQWDWGLDEVHDVFTANPPRPADQRMRRRPSTSSPTWTCSPAHCSAGSLRPHLPPIRRSRPPRSRRRPPGARSAAAPRP